MRLRLVIFIAVLHSAYSEEKAELSALRVVADPIETSYREKLVDEGLDKIANRPVFLLTIEADFDCDGHSDVAITDCFEAGAKAGTWWSIFLKRADGKYAEAGSVGTKAARFKITPNAKSGGDLAVMLRGGPGDLLIEFYRVTQRSLKKTGEESVLIPEDHVGPTRINEVFGGGFSEKSTKRISLEELKKKYPK